MTPATIELIAATIKAAYDLAPELYRTGKNVAVFGRQILDDLVNKKTVTEEQRLAIEAKIAELEASALAPLPPEQPDDV